GAGDRRFESVADLDGEIALGVAELGEIDHPLGLAAEVDEGGRVADLGHRALDLLADRRILAGVLALLLLELRQDLAEVLALLGLHRLLILHRVFTPACRAQSRSRSSGFAPPRAFFRVESIMPAGIG